MQCQYSFSFQRPRCRHRKLYAKPFWVLRQDISWRSSDDNCIHVQIVLHQAPVRSQHQQRSNIHVLQAGWCLLCCPTNSVKAMNVSNLQQRGISLQMLRSIVRASRGDSVGFQFPAKSIISGFYPGWHSDMMQNDDILNVILIIQKQT